IKCPCAVLTGCDLLSVPGPFARRAICDHVAGAIQGFDRRRDQITILDGNVHQSIERTDRLVVGHVLLRLGGRDVGKLQVWCLKHGSCLPTGTDPPSMSRIGRPGITSYTGVRTRAILWRPDFSRRPPENLPTADEIPESAPTEWNWNSIPRPLTIPS